jgi:hypothetical protein
MVHSNIYDIHPISQTSRSIRLLHIDPLAARSTDDEAPLSGSISVVSLSESPKFTALSYVWGNDPIPFSKSFLCGEYEIPISQNAYKALVSLRWQVGHVKIWVDAICINQQHEKERNHQVTMMEEIYSSAETVYIWLGDGNSHTDQAIKCLRLTPRNQVNLQSMDERLRSAGTSFLVKFWLLLKDAAWMEVFGPFIRRKNDTFLSVVVANTVDSL